VKQIIFILGVILLSYGCKGPLASPEAAETKPGMHKVTVNEAIQAGGYTYLNVSERRKKFWLAVPAMQASKGDKISYEGGLVMTDFKSRELNRTFSSIIFLENVKVLSRKDAPAETVAPHVANVKTEKINVAIEPGKDCITLAKLLEGKADYAGKVVRVKGKVTKYNTAILGKNWVHIQDGTEFNGNFDLTITTDSEVAVGDTTTFEGKLVLNKDFGYGYSYEVLMEDAKLIK
jgi:hypothetical protein